MGSAVPFVRVLAFLEEHGWEFTDFWTPYRVFKKPGRMPILVEVHNKVVDHEAFEHIKAVVKRDQEEGEGE